MSEFYKGVQIRTFDGEIKYLESKIYFHYYTSSYCKINYNYFLSEHGYHANCSLFTTKKFANACKIVSSYCMGIINIIDLEEAIEIDGEGFLTDGRWD